MRDQQGRWFVDSRLVSPLLSSQQNKKKYLRSIQLSRLLQRFKVFLRKVSQEDRTMFCEFSICVWVGLDFDVSRTLLFRLADQVMMSEILTDLVMSKISSHYVSKVRSFITFRGYFHGT